MTIMGLLSAFSIVVPAAILDRVASAKLSDASLFAQIWNNDRILILSGSLAFLAATLSFYLQRSLLAIYYGRLRFNQTPARYANMSEVRILRDADSWQTWTSYQSGFVLLPLGFVLYGAALFAPHLPTPAQSWVVGGLGGPALIFIVLNRCVKRTADKSGTDYPWRSFFCLSLPPD
jgi:hypothetical protein